MVAYGQRKWLIKIINSYISISSIPLLLHVLTPTLFSLPGLSFDFLLFSFFKRFILPLSLFLFYRLLKTSFLVSKSSSLPSYTRWCVCVCIVRFFWCIYKYIYTVYTMHIVFVCMVKHARGIRCYRSKEKAVKRRISFITLFTTTATKYL